MKLSSDKHYPINFCLLLFFLVAMLACSEDDGGDAPEVDPLVGTYTFKSATFVNGVEITLNGQKTTFPPNSDATAFVSGGLLGTAPCDNPANAALELRENGQGFFVCQGENNEAQAGTWEVNEGRTKITLLITNPAPVTILIENFKLENNVLSGRISNFPLVKDNQYTLGAPLPGGGGLNLQTTSVDIEFTKVD